MQKHDGRALTDHAVDRIHEQFYKGKIDDQDVERLFDTIKVQKKVLREMFKLFQENPRMTRECFTDPIRTSTLMYFKERVAMEDPQCVL